MALIEPASRAGTDAGAMVADRAGDGGWVGGGWMVVVEVADDWIGPEG